MRARVCRVAGGEEGRGRERNNIQNLVTMGKRNRPKVETAAAAFAARTLRPGNKLISSVSYCSPVTIKRRRRRLKSFCRRRTGDKRLMMVRATLGRFLRPTNLIIPARRRESALLTS